MNRPSLPTKIKDRVPIVHIASSNPGKLAELRRGFLLWTEPKGPDSGWIIEPVPGFNHLPPCAEDADSFAGNAAKKALHYSRFVPGLVLADDSGLEVDALGGAPGIYSARFAGPDATDAENNARLLEQMKDVPTDRRTGRFVCVLAVAREGELLAQFRGVAEGLILDAPRGAAGFGYDPLFFDPALGKTFAELSPEEKLQRSHRGQALRALLEWLGLQSGERG